MKARFGTAAERASLRERFNARAVRFRDTCAGLAVDALVLRLDTRRNCGARPMWIFMGLEHDIRLPWQITVRS